MFADALLDAVQTPAQEYLAQAIEESQKEGSAVVETVRDHLESQGLKFAAASTLRAEVIARLRDKRAQDVAFVGDLISNAWAIGFAAGLEESTRRGRR